MFLGCLNYNIRFKRLLYLFVSLLTTFIFLEGCTFQNCRSNVTRRIAMDNRILNKIRGGICAIGYFEGKIEEYNFKVVGTGFMVRNTTVITNRHVLEALKVKQEQLGFTEDKIFLEFIYPVEKGKWQEAFCRFKFQSIIANKELDIGLIEFVRRPEPEFERCVPLELGDPLLASTGQPIGIFGYPYGSDLLDVKIRNLNDIQEEFRRFGPILHQGYISAIAPFDNVGIVDKFILDISYAGGMSGSPVFKLEDGSVIGLFYAGMGNAVGFAIPIDKERVNKWLELYEQLREKQN